MKLDKHGCDLQGRGLRGLVDLDDFLVLWPIAVFDGLFHEKKVFGELLSLNTLKNGT